jgi:hypothetical protein
LKCLAGLGLLHGHDIVADVPKLHPKHVPEPLAGVESKAPLIEAQWAPLGQVRNN